MSVHSALADATAPNPERTLNEEIDPSLRQHAACLPNAEGLRQAQDCVGHALTYICISIYMYIIYIYMYARILH